jgi:hypothetical protein
VVNLDRNCLVGKHYFATVYDDVDTYGPIVTGKKRFTKTSEFLEERSPDSDVLSSNPRVTNQ